MHIPAPSIAALEELCLFIENNVSTYSAGYFTHLTIIYVHGKNIFLFYARYHSKYIPISVPISHTPFPQKVRHLYAMYTIERAKSTPFVHHFTPKIREFTGNCMTFSTVRQSLKALILLGFQAYIAGFLYRSYGVT